MSSLSEDLSADLGGDEDVAEPGVAPTSNFTSLLEILLSGAQDLEDTMVEWRDQTLDDATGFWLEHRWGSKVGLRRSASPLFTPIGDTTADDTYRRAIRAQIATNRSNGRREALLAIARLIVVDSAATIAMQRRPTATLFVQVVDAAVSASTLALLVQFLTRAAPNGVRLVAQANTSSPTEVFKFAGGGRPAGPGFDNRLAPGSGGTLDDRRG